MDADEEKEKEVFLPQRAQSSQRKKTQKNFHAADERRWAQVASVGAAREPPFLSLRGAKRRGNLIEPINHAERR
jgi:hypothetical protein